MADYRRDPMEIYTIVTRNEDHKLECGYVVARSVIEKSVAHVINEAIKDETITKVLVLKGEWSSESVISALSSNSLVFSWHKDDGIPAYFFK